MIASILDRHPSPAQLQDLDGNTKSLRETTHRFVKMITTPPLEIMTTCFWETQESQVLKAVVPASLLTQISRVFKSTKMIVRKYYLYRWCKRLNPMIYSWLKKILRRYWDAITSLLMHLTQR